VRIAWFSPLPPVTTGVAAVSAGLLPALRARGHLIDAYPEAQAHDFPWIHRQRPYDLIVYQFGNSSHHDYEWPYALRYPGLVVLHDTRLHHARAALLLREKRRDEYRRELHWNEPDLHPDAAELAVAGFDSRLYYEWSMVRGLVMASRVVAVHGDATRRELVEALSEVRGPKSEVRSPILEKLVAIRLGHGELVTPERERAARARIRARYGIAPEAMVFGVFGGLTPEKRLPQILDAYRAVRPYAPDARLLLGGAEAAHFPLDAFRGADGVIVTGYIEDGDLTDHIAAVDVSLNLRWPTARETSGPWLRALAAGKPTVVTELLHLTDVATLDPRTWLVTDVEVRSPTSEARSPGSEVRRTSDLGSRTSPAMATAIAVDIVDEDHSLRLAMRRLATDAALRARLGSAAQEWWKSEHSLEAMVDDYESVLAECGAGGAGRETDAEDREGMPEHLRPDGDETLRALLRPFGIDPIPRAGAASQPRASRYDGQGAETSERSERVGESEGRRPSDQK
jgi:glycosyltransferase involved in cell wall biosynthesis